MKRSFFCFLVLGIIFLGKICFSLENIDPFLPLLPKKEEAKKSKIIEAKEITPPTLKVQGIVWDTDIPQAIIEDKVVGIGDTVGEAKVVSIEREGVSVIYKGRLFVLSVSKDSKP